LLIHGKKSCIAVPDLARRSSSAPGGRQRGGVLVGLGRARSVCGAAWGAAWWRGLGPFYVASPYSEDDELKPVPAVCAGHAHVRCSDAYVVETLIVFPASTAGTACYLRPISDGGSGIFPGAPLSWPSFVRPTFSSAWSRPTQSSLRPTTRKRDESFRWLALTLLPRRRCLRCHASQRCRPPSVSPRLATTWVVTMAVATEEHQTGSCR
jgi:hypothetical protein